jgi:hypothetical protein
METPSFETTTQVFVGNHSMNIYIMSRLVSIWQVLSEEEIQSKRQPWYNWNIVKSDTQHHNSPNFFPQKYEIGKYPSSSRATIWTAITKTSPKDNILFGIKKSSNGFFFLTISKQVISIKMKWTYKQLYCQI